MSETMLSYTKEQSFVLKDMFNNLEINGEPYVEFFGDNNYNKLIFVGSGTSYHSAMAAKPFIESILNVEVQVSYPYMFAHYEKLSDMNSIVIGISQSGKSKATLDSLKKAQKLGIKTMAITMDPDTELAHIVDQSILVPCGEEKVPFKTKGYLSTLFSLYIGALYTAKVKSIISQLDFDNYAKALQKAINNIDSIIKKSEQWYAKNKQLLTKSNRISVIGFGPNFGTALEGALKLNETVRVAINGYELEEYMHGPHLELNDESTVFIIANQGIGKERSIKLFDFVSTITNNGYLISDEGDGEDEKVLNINSSNSEMFSPLEYVIPLQVIAYNLAVDKGVNLEEAKFKHFNDWMKTKNDYTV